MAAGGRWPAVVGLSLVVMLQAVVQPALLVFVPLGLLLVALPSRPRQLYLLGLGVLLLVLTLLIGQHVDMLWYAQRGWVLVLGAWFIAVVVAWPQATFISRALAAVAGSAGTASLVFLFRRAPWQQLDWTIGQLCRQVAATFVAQANAGAEGREFADAMMHAADLAARFYPAAVGLGSVAALGLAWWAYRRLVAWESPLGLLRDFRFSDDLVWVLIAGLALVVAPLGDVAARFGGNVLGFMAALYALRGLAVVVALVGMPGVVGTVVVAIVALVLLPIMMMSAAVLGITDTWLDLRTRVRSGME
ncbi:MAG: DUF2232 domain-containing protein [Gemmatimonadota bacterium]